METLQNKLKNDDLLKLINLSELICTNAERKSYGIKAKDANLHDDESDNALWFWELTNISLLSQRLQKNSQQERSQRAMLG